jgi:hypothetical protein
MRDSVTDLEIIAEKVPQDSRETVNLKAKGKTVLGNFL